MHRRRVMVNVHQVAARLAHLLHLAPTSWECQRSVRLTFQAPSTVPPRRPLSPSTRREILPRPERHGVTLISALAPRCGAVPRTEVLMPVTARDRRAQVVQQAYDPDVMREGPDLEPGESNSSVA